MSFNPSEDGVTHLNVYSKARTTLGTFLSNFTRSHIVTEDGPFESIEGYWYWLGTQHPDRDGLRALYGWHAKQFGRELKALDWQENPEFVRKICAAITIKIKSNPSMYEALRNNTLPLAHYYVFGGKVVEPKEGRWILDHISALAKEGGE